MSAAARLGTRGFEVGMIGILEREDMVSGRGEKSFLLGMYAEGIVSVCVEDDWYW